MSDNNIGSPVRGLRMNSLKQSLAAGAAVTALLCGTAYAQQAAGSEQMETVYVTGYRASLESALSTKRQSNEMVDAINAEDIAAFPDANLAEALQRLPGVAVDRDEGEGRTITVRGLGQDFTRVTLNGLEALSTAGASDSSGSTPNRDRGFDFNTFAAELFSSLEVQKSSSAATEEGSLGATVGLNTGHPFDMGGKERFVLGGQNAYYEFGKPFNPRIIALASDTFLGGRLGALVSAAVMTRSQTIDSYQRSPGQSDYAYRGSAFAGVVLPDNSSIVGRNGFAAPTGTACTGANGVVPGATSLQAGVCAAESGSNAATYALINTPRGWTLTDSNTASPGTTSTVTAPGSLVLIPGLASLNHQVLYQRRLGLTSSVQWQPDDNTLFTLDGLYSNAYQDSTNYSLSGIGINRNNTSTTLNAATTSTAATTLRSMFSTCTAQTASSTQAGIDCGQAIYGGGLVAGTANSYNPKNLDIYDYYATPLYLGTAGKPANAIAQAISFIGRPSTKLLDAQVVNGAATYLKLDNVDMRSAADQVYYTTQFEQLSLNGSHTFNDKVKGDFTIGWSKSHNHQTGLLGELNKMDSGTASGDSPFIWDDTAGGDMPSMSFGFNVADPTRWDFVKGFSALRHYEYYVDNKYRTLIANLSYDVTDQFTFRVGATVRMYDFGTSYYQRAYKDVVNPSFLEEGVTAAQMTQVVGFGKGLDAPTGTPTSWIAPNLNKYESVIGFNCNCENQYGDWRLTNLFNPASTGTAGSTYGVSEHSKSGYAQVDFHDVMILGNPLRGNVGIRFADTNISSVGHALQGNPVVGSNHYTDFLPSANLIYSLTDDMLFRVSAAKVMSRPSLNYLAPSITAMSIPSTVGATTGATMTIGNPKLSPYRAKTVDIGWEWYFDKGAVLAVTGFAKWVSNNPQVVANSGSLSTYLTSDQLTAIEAYYAANPSTANTAILAYLQGNNQITSTQAQNGPGGILEGVEVTYQQQLTFLPDPFDGFGINANYTHLKTVEHYIISSSPTTGVTPCGLLQCKADGQWNGASPDAFNFTLYYDGKDWGGRAWEGRVSAAYRSSYVYLYPAASGTSLPGFSDSPLVNEFGYSKNTLYIDSSWSYTISDNFELTLDALNLTNQNDRRWAYVASPQTTRDAATGRSVFAGVRFTY